MATLNEIVLDKVDYSNQVMFMFEGENITYTNPVLEACGLIRAYCWNNGAMIQLDPRTEGNKKVLLRVLKIISTNFQ